MNERIRELIKQMDQAETPTGGGAFTLYDTDLEYFAELIVRECAQACTNMGNDYEIKSAGQYQAELFAFAIKKHFGVEL